MFRPKDKWAEIVATNCGAVALFAKFAFGNLSVAFLAAVVGIAVLAWSYLNVIR